MTESGTANGSSSGNGGDDSQNNTTDHAEAGAVEHEHLNATVDFKGGCVYTEKMQKKTIIELVLDLVHL